MPVPRRLWRQSWDGACDVEAGRRQVDAASEWRDEPVCDGHSASPLGWLQLSLLQAGHVVSMPPWPAGVSCGKWSLVYRTNPESPRACASGCMAPGPCRLNLVRMAADAKRRSARNKEERADATLSSSPTSAR